ncbi:MAG: FHA domain-containing protein [Victivallales bacterium]|jgi:pSer/pThr/pTyr-binding forkhead associated (FHA) protein|nr:FHA domain-containing protein [Victivallales bacterium]
MADYPKLTVLYEKLRGKVFELNKDQMTIGRRDGNDIVIKDASLSGHHADIIRTLRDGKTVYLIKDNDSTNGTRVNNIPVTEQELKNSDIILFGGVEVLFDSNDGAETQVGNTTVTIDISQLDSTISTVPRMNSLDPFAGTVDKKSIMLHRIMLGIYALLALGILAVVGFLIYNIIKM